MSTLEGQATEENYQINTFFVQKGLLLKEAVLFGNTPSFETKSLSIEIIDDDGLVQTHTFSISKFSDEEQNGGYTLWSGETENGLIRIASENDQSSIYLKIYDKEFTIKEGLDSQGFLYEVPESQYSHCGLEGENVIQTGTEECEFEPCLAFAKVLVLHRRIVDPPLYHDDDNLPPVFNALSNARRLQVLSVLSINQDVLNNSGIPIHLTYEFLYVDAPDETDGSTMFLSELANFLPFYSQLRIDRNAELVQLIIDDSTWGLAGLAYTDDLSFPDINEHFFSFAHLWASSSTRYTSIHEIAHLLGASHNPVANGGSGDNGIDCSGGWRFKPFISELSRTVMANAQLDGQRVPYFSDPDVVFAGDAYGTIFNNNAEVLELNSCMLDVQQYVNPFSFEYDSALPWCVDLDDPSDPNRYITVNPIAPNPLYVQPGNPPYEINWYQNGSTTPISQAFTLDCALLDESQNVVSVRFVLSSADGIVLEDEFDVHNLDDCVPFSNQLTIDYLGYRYFDFLGREINGDDFYNLARTTLCIRCDQALKDCVKVSIVRQ